MLGHDAFFGVQRHDAALFEAFFGVRRLVCAVFKWQRRAAALQIMNPHAPPHWLLGQGIYMVTAGTHQKLPHLNTPERRDYFLDMLFARAAEFGWQLQAWAVLPNHYHFIAASPEDPGTLRKFLAKLHMTTAKQLNAWDSTPGRKVWYHFWDSHITFENSYLARLNYVNHNPAHHGLTGNASEYRWCSAKWFTEHAPSALVEQVANCKSDKLDVADDF